jgi:hypothetical protein
MTVEPVVVMPETDSKKASVSSCRRRRSERHRAGDRHGEPQQVDQQEAEARCGLRRAALRRERDRQGEAAEEQRGEGESAPVVVP